MCTYFEKRGYSRILLERDLQRVSRVSRRDTIQDANVLTNGTERIPLVLTYHPFNSHIKKSIQANFNILMNDETTGEIFPVPSSATISILSSTTPECSRYSCAHFHAKSVWVFGRHIQLWRHQMSYRCISHHHHRWTTIQRHHKGPFHLLIQQCGPLHFMSSLPGPVHWGNQAHAQGTHRWTLLVSLLRNIISTSLDTD